MRTVLMFAHECAPYHRRESTIGAQRPAHFAKYLPAFGWRAIVICCDARARGAGATTQVLPELDEALDDLGRPSESLIVPTPSLPYDGWLDRLWNFLGPASRPWPGRDPLRRPLTAFKLRWGDYSQGWQPVARAVAQRIAQRVPIDICLGLHSPDAGLHLARWFSRRYAVPWIADFRDPILQPLSPLMRRLYAPTARALLQSASTVVNVTPYWSALDAQELGRPARTIPNGYDETEFPAGTPGSDRHLTITYVGNMWDEMQPELFLQGLACLRTRVGRERFEGGVRFTYRGLAFAYIRQLADRAGVSTVVDAMPYVPREEALSLLAGSDALLLLAIPPDPARDRYLARGIYPGKLFEYLGARRPIILVPGDDGQSDELLRRTRAGTPLRTPDEIARWLEAALDRKEGGEDLPYEPDELERARYSRRTLAGELAVLLDRVVDARESDSLPRPASTAQPA